MRILIAVPTYDGTCSAGIAYSLLLAKSKHGNDIDFVTTNGSLLAHTFNLCWCLALNNSKYTHFLMMHSDIVPKDADWLEKLIELGADTDILSVVSPIKDVQGFTSTAILHDGLVRRLTMHEIYQLPQTFDEAKVLSALGYKKGTLLVNTGLMLVKMDKRDLLEQMFFTINDKIQKNDKGEFETLVMSEDWNWSIQAKELGLTIQATRGIAFNHHGVTAFPNYVEWGQAKHDTANL